MNIILFLIFLAFFLGNKSDKKKSDLFKGLLAFAIIIAVIGSISPILWIIAIGLIIFVASQKFDLSLTIEERVRRINDRYFTRFNEMSFMIAYRFLQRKGRSYDLSRPDLVKNVDQELEEVMKKYGGVKAGGK